MFSHKKHLVMTCTLACSQAFLTACSSDDPVDPVPLDSDPEVLIWRSCSTESTLQCAELKVPAAYNEESAADITLGLNRRLATSQPARGSLLFNPGGPGGSGIQLLEDLVDRNTIPDSVLDAYDLIGFDPRGIGASTPVDCSEFGIDDLDLYVTDRAEIDGLINMATRAATDCHAKYGDYLQQLGSLNVVRDMDSIRQALGEDTLDFIGYSYGTRLASLYLQTYPESSGAMVLDASISPDSSLSLLVEGALPVLQSNLEDMLSQCTRVTPECSLDDLLLRLGNKVSELLAAENTDEFELLGTLVLEGATDPEFGDFLVAPLVSYLLNENVSVLEDFVTFLDSLGADGADNDEGITAQIAVLCADDDNRPTADDLETLLNTFNTRSDLLAEAYLPLAASCVGWPEAIEPLPLITTRTAPASLVIGGTTDAQTPLIWSDEMAESIGGYFLASSHRGHTAVFSERSACVDDRVVDFLLNDQLPVSGNCLANTD